MERRARGWWLLCAAAALAACARGDPASKSRSCGEVRQIYGAKGFSLSDVPQAEISGEHLRICPQGYTCCTSEMEENLANRSRTELETGLRDSSRALHITLTAQLRGFDDYFQRLLNSSERALQDTFPAAFGDLYTQNTKAFRDLYAELRLYYRGANLHLEETLAEFWARLLERLFRQLHPQLLLPEDYLDCLGKQAEALRPFGDAPRELRLRATRAFVAARAFVQGLGVTSDVVRKVAQVPLGPECSRAIMKLVYCAHCLGVPGARPCPNYCRNVLKGCLANQADLDAEWRNLLDSMVLITDKFWGPSGTESVISSVHMWLAEAIDALQDNRDTLTAKVIQGCGNPQVNPQSTGPEEKRHRGKLESQEKTPSGVLEKLVSEAKAQLRDVQDFWVSLPGTLCSERVVVSTASDDRCWNGMTKGRYLPEVMGDGLANQINNPEVEVDITKPDMTIRQQIMQLKIMTNRLRSAYNGKDVDFQDASDDGSGSGSGGGCPDDVCGHRVSKKGSSSRTTATHALPGLSEREGSSSTGPRPQAPLFLLLLTLVLAAPRPRWRLDLATLAIYFLQGPQVSREQVSPKPCIFRDLRGTVVAAAACTCCPAHPSTSALGIPRTGVEYPKDHVSEGATNPQCPAALHHCPSTKPCLDPPSSLFFQHTTSLPGFVSMCSPPELRAKQPGEQVRGPSHGDPEGRAVPHMSCSHSEGQNACVQVYLRVPGRIYLTPPRLLPAQPGSPEAICFPILTASTAFMPSTSRAGETQMPKLCYVPLETSHRSPATGSLPHTSARLEMCGKLPPEPLSEDCPGLAMSLASPCSAALVPEAPSTQGLQCPTSERLGLNSVFNNLKSTLNSLSEGPDPKWVWRPP
ncbi:PREDICTED: glypican-1 [Chrysochloris asiatica]|uniref:Glypican-1 n=1 Tax=Chrysochloris asiatica TaxID=185453 RepID=A0A9B0X1N5_CHRAS|nr:PREDICTED: glypican-1 [Chrysochloris asiatica]